MWPLEGYTGKKPALDAGFALWLNLYLQKNSNPQETLYNELQLCF